MKQEYKEINFAPKTYELIQLVNAIIRIYQAQGFTLSVRQIYYQLVARDIIPNTEQSYKRVANVINDGRTAGLIDWDAIEDRNRDIELKGRWSSGSDIIQACVNSFHMDMWDSQDHRVIVIVEKAALAGVLGGVCDKYDVPLLAARGYPSVSIVREMAMKHITGAINNGQFVTVLHLGDHDPSGIDMTRDLRERFEMFIKPEVARGDEDMFTLERIALSMDQIREKAPPPNPAKATDARFKEYQKRYGSQSWELDALEPAYLNNLVEGKVTDLIDDDRWAKQQARIDEVKSKLAVTAQQWKNDEDDEL